jgi:hypothetical protein
MFSIILIVFLTACNNKTPSEKLIFPIEMQPKIMDLMAQKKVIIYYHSGECSMCYGTLLAISKEFPDLPLVSISASSNAVLIDYYLEQIGFKGISLIDSTSLFLTGNQKVLSTQNLFLIDPQYKIIAGGENLDENTKKRISHAIQ